MEKIAVIAAGGFGNRLGSDVPKSLLRFHCKTYLQILLEQIECFNFGRIYIFCNRQEHINEVLKASVTVKNTVVINDKGSCSTFSLLQKAAKMSKNCDYYFFYGHAPRPSKDIQTLVDFDAEGCILSTYASSSRANKMILGGAYAEPPYRIRVSSDLIESSKDWSSFFKKLNGDFKYVHFCSPPEFNFPKEHEKYISFLNSWVNGLSDVLTNEGVNMGTNLAGT